MATYDNFRAISNIQDSQISEQLNMNLINFFDWGFINKGAYFNVTLPTSGEFGGDYSRLRLVDEPNYTLGQVWEGYRKDWVWQSGISQGTPPIQVSGVYVDSTFQPSSGVGTYAHHVNYPLGRIVFDTAIPTGSVVQAEFSPKWIQISNLREVPLLKEVQYNADRIDFSQFLQVSSGDWSALSQTRMQLPTIAIEINANRTYEPIALGTSAQYAMTDVTFHILGQDDWSTSKIADIVSYQNDKKIYLFDVDKLADEDVKLLNVNGSITSGTLTYPDLVKPSGDGGYRNNSCRFSNARLTNAQWLHDNLHYMTVKLTTEVPLCYN